jgi:hypothetical protein
LEPAAAVREIHEYGLRGLRAFRHFNGGADGDAWIGAAFAASVQGTCHEQSPNLGGGRESDQEMKAISSQAAAHGRRVFGDGNDAQRPAGARIRGAAAANTLDAAWCHDEEVARRGHFGRDLASAKSLVDDVLIVQNCSDIVEFTIIYEKDARIGGRNSHSRLHWCARRDRRRS